ncbi:hypothetical protein GGR57DRAFT_498942 [Xylariaceae sp. FL1272]|nr:hypothetical protein GGR57DRAFT_498942 [Xylariaceae sp. FL1272]
MPGQVLDISGLECWDGKGILHLRDLEGSGAFDTVATTSSDTSFSLYFTNATTTDDQASTPFLLLHRVRSFTCDSSPNSAFATRNKATKTNMSYFRITLHRSAIGLPERTRGVLAALGLRKRCQTVFKPVSPDAAGMIMKVKELVRVEEVDKAMTPKELRDSRRPEPGFYIEKAVPR